MPTYGADIATEEINITDGTTLLDALNKLISDTVLWSDAVKWFNDGINELANYLEIETKSQITTTAGTLNYPIPLDCQSIYKADLPFDTWGTDIILYGDPGNSSFNLYYYRKPLYLATVYDIPADVPSNAHYALALYAAMRYMQSEDDFEQAKEFEKAFEKKKALLIEYIKAKKLKEASGNTLLSSLNKLVGDIVLWDIAKGWLNDGINELTNELDIETSAQIVTTSGVMSYPIPSDCISVVKADKPFDTWGSNIVFYDNPGNGTATIYYHRKPGYLVNVQDLPADIPVNFHYALVLYAAMRYKQSEKDFDQAISFEKEFSNKKTLLIQYVRDRKSKKASTDNTLLSRLNKLVEDVVLWDVAKEWLNDGINELTNDLGIETTSQITTVAGTLSYPIPSNCLSITEIALPFDIWGGNIIFRDDPLDGTVDLFYYRKPTYLVNASDLPTDVPVSSHYALVLYAAMRYKQSKGKLQEAATLEKAFEKKKDLMIDQVNGALQPSFAQVVW